MSEKIEILKAKDLSKTFSNESVQQHVLKELKSPSSQTISWHSSEDTMLVSFSSRIT